MERKDGGFAQVLSETAVDNPTVECQWATCVALKGVHTTDSRSRRQSHALHSDFYTSTIPTINSSLLRPQHKSQDAPPNGMRYHQSGSTQMDLNGINHKQPQEYTGQSFFSSFSNSIPRRIHPLRGAGNHKQNQWFLQEAADGFVGGGNDRLWLTFVTREQTKCFFSRLCMSQWAENGII
ncbi:hypothetical protein ASPWEDRAFT_427727 [Aspergillus wentii DTO 134E9]|uniref:Uncharacterized protein n=1 Tax=Aspergillus wentii DTO 134E9 TaxID=1073089 RepID=A0A1L9RPE6_ASPWE|nr:uncharacterized protein ASPWEDRAFT_427727 [Aspergillus wentii DTO 134E9]OJJ36799.1 hypothetical protein ASPWEDRAFT_427727 [Aspergillus wentii DTO 134E9]